jgi:hypothetical protein
MNLRQLRIRIEHLKPRRRQEIAPTPEEGGRAQMRLSLTNTSCKTRRE